MKTRVKHSGDGHTHAHSEGVTMPDRWWCPDNTHARLSTRQRESKHVLSVRACMWVAVSISSISDEFECQPNFRPGQCTSYRENTYFILCERGRAFHREKKEYTIPIAAEIVLTVR